MLSLREQAIKIVRLICQFSNLRNQDYVNFHLMKDQKKENEDLKDH